MLLWFQEGRPGGGGGDENGPASFQMEDRSSTTTMDVHVIGSREHFGY